jgi:hypothetical protein
MDMTKLIVAFHNFANAPETQNLKSFMPIDVAIPADTHVIEKKAVKIQAFMCAEHEMHDYTFNNWSHRKSNKMFIKRNLEYISRIRKTFISFTKKESCTWNKIHNTESTSVWNLKPERRASLFAEEEKYQREKSVTKKTVILRLLLLLLLLLLFRISVQLTLSSMVAVVV